MTLTTTADPVDECVPSDPLRVRLGLVAEHVSMAGALLWWGFVLTYHSGGRDRWALTLAIGPALAALVAVRPWRVVSGPVLGLAAAVAAAPVAVSLIDPTHWYAASQAATYAYSAVLFVAVRVYAVTPGRRAWVVAVVLAAAVTQFGWSFVDWQRTGQPTAPMVGRFFWHNQYAAFLLVPAIVGAGLAVVGASQLRALGAVVALLGATGIVLSTSRATMALLALGWFVVGVVAVGSGATWVARRRRLLRWLALSAAAAGLMWWLPGPPFFSARLSPYAGTASRSVGQSVTQNGSYRLDFWHASLHNFVRHPWTGTGFGSFGRQDRLIDPTGPHAELVHNGFLQMLSDGGLLLAAPVLLACALITVGLLRRLRPAVWGVESGAITLLAAGSLLLAVHSALDFDWSYSSCMAASAILAALALAWSPGAAAPAAATLRTLRGSQVAVLALVLVTLVLAQRAIPGGWLRNAPVNPAASAKEAPAQ